jgi:hypothetical protein
LATLFTVSLAYALLFGLLRLMSAPPSLVGYVALFVTVVGLAQAVVLQGKPRAASILAGLLFWLVATFFVIMPRSMAGIVALCVGVLCTGVVTGYVAGLLVAGVFLVADLVRKAVRFVRAHGEAEASENNVARGDSPFD